MYFSCIVLISTLLCFCLSPGSIALPLGVNPAVAQVGTNGKPLCLSPQKCHLPIAFLGREENLTMSALLRANSKLPLPYNRRRLSPLSSGLMRILGFGNTAFSAGVEIPDLGTNAQKISGPAQKDGNQVDSQSDNSSQKPASQAKSQDNGLKKPVANSQKQSGKDDT
ncbi:unnamed protein product [Somion occarium]|uniref:Uncharacterized protein n=1 Tax=Somion occarium TaxID=3059160 RepID=A0ABP1CSS9_9APHY